MRKTRAITVILVLILLTSAFYWYSYRPSRVAKICIGVAVEQATAAHGDPTYARYLFWKCEEQYGIAE